MHEEALTRWWGTPTGNAFADHAASLLAAAAASRRGDPRERE